MAGTCAGRRSRAAIPFNRSSGRPLSPGDGRAATGGQRAASTKRAHSDGAVPEKRRERTVGTERSFNVGHQRSAPLATERDGEEPEAKQRQGARASVRRWDGFGKAKLLPAAIPREWRHQCTHLTAGDRELLNSRSRAGLREARGRSQAKGHVGARRRLNPAEGPL
jgi:hypothetical protein